MFGYGWDKSGARKKWKSLFTATLAPVPAPKEGRRVIWV